MLSAAVPLIYVFRLGFDASISFAKFSPYTAASIAPFGLSSSRLSVTRMPVIFAFSVIRRLVRIGSLIAICFALLKSD